MTVRAWFTISALCLLALTAAVVVRYLQPLQPPELLARAGEERLEGIHEASCWPQRDGELLCRTDDTVVDAEPPALPADGAFRVIAAYPVQPEDGTIRILDATGDTVVEEDWTDRLDYELRSGRYSLWAEARYAEDGYVRYRFPFRIP